MTLSRLNDLAAADWLVEHSRHWQRLISLGPLGFQAYARLRFIPDPARADMAESDVELPEDHPSDLTQSRIALTCLDDLAVPCVFAVWEGWPAPYLDPALTAGPLLELPHRRYVLFSGRLAEILDWGAQFGGRDGTPPPAFVWPSDRRWCFTCDVDPHWAGIGGPQALVSNLIARPELDVVPASPEVPPPYYAH